MTILTLPQELLNYAETCIRLKLYHMYDLAKELDLRFEDLRDTMQNEMLDDYKYFTKGFTGAMSRARKRSVNKEIEETDQQLKKLLQMCISRKYTAYDLSNLKEYDIEDLLRRARKIAKEIDLHEIEVDFERSISDDLDYHDLEKYQTANEFQKDLLIRDWELDRTLRKICKNDEYLVRKILNNVWNNKNYSDKKLQSLAACSLRNAQLDRSNSSISRLSSNRSAQDSIEDLVKDLYSIQEIAKMKNIEVTDKKMIEAKKILPLKISKADRRQIAFLHFEEIKKSHDMNAISKLVEDGRMSLTEVCQVCKIPISLKKFITEIGLIDGRIVRRGSSIFSARNGKTHTSNASALQSIESSDTMKEIFAEQIASELYSERLYQVSKLRDVSNRKQSLHKIFARYSEVTGRTDSYPDSEVLSVLKIDMTLNDAIEFMNERLLNVTDQTLSSYEMKIKDLLDDLRVEYKINDRTVFDYSFEIDFLIESRRLAIEVSPISSHHSNLSKGRYFGAKPNSYHYQKYLNAKLKGYELLTLYEYDLDEQNFKDFTEPLIRSKICNVRTHYARNTDFAEIDTAEAREFLEKYHRDGYRNSMKKYCLRLNDEIVAVATVSRIKDKVYRLERLAYRSNEKIIGGTSKIVKNLFRQIEDMETLETFSDNDKGSGESYRQARFTFISETGPRKLYISNANAKDRYSWQISGPFDHSTGRTVVGASMIKNNLDPTNFNEDQIEEYIETQLEHRLDKGRGYDRLFTAGSKKWKISRNEVI